MESYDIEKIKFNKIVEKYMPKSNLSLNCFRAFWVGGTICTLGQILTNFFSSIGLPKDEIGFFTSFTLIFISVILTSIGIYDKIGNYAGAGSAVPITGFANAICSPAIEFKKEGYILGMGAKIFIVAGPVILYGLLTSVFVGFIYYFLNWNN